MNKKNILTLGVVFATMFAPVAFGANIGDRADDLKDQVSSITTLIVYAAALFGIIFLVVGGLNLKKHGDNPQQVPLSKPLIFLAAGSLLFGLSATSDTLQSTLFGGESSREGASIDADVSV